MRASLRVPLYFLFLLLNFHVLSTAQAVTTLLVRTDMTCNWKLDGALMGELMPENPKVILVSSGLHLIEASASDGVAKTRTTVEVGKVETTADIQLKNPFKQQPMTKQVVKPRTDEQAEEARKTTWTDPDTGLMWTAKDNGSDVDWPQASAYCSKLRLAGYSDWRLPTTVELQGIYDPRVSIQKQFDNGVTYEVHVKGNLSLTGWTWSGSVGEFQGQPSQSQWIVMLETSPNAAGGEKNPLLLSQHISHDTRALCVRLASP